jgi:hypothetical protein
MELRRWAIEQAVQIGQAWTVDDVLNRARRLVAWVENGDRPASLKDIITAVSRPSTQEADQ